MDRPSKVFGRFEFALDEGLIDDHFGRHVRQLTSLPGFDLFPHRLEVPLNSIDPNRNAVDQRK